MKSLESTMRHKKALTPYQERKAYEAAYLFYSSRLVGGGLDTQKNVALRNGIAPPRFSEALNDAWRAGILDVIINPPEKSPDYIKMRELETRLKNKLAPYSPFVSTSTEQKMHKFKKIHIVAAPPDLPLQAGLQGYDDLFHSTRAHVCRRAAKEFFTLIHDMHMKNDNDAFYVGISWGRTCQGVLNLVPIPPEPFTNLVACPLIGIIGHRDTPLDANTLAYRLGASLSGKAIKLPVPCLRPLEIQGLEKLRPVAKALEEIERCQMGISGVAPVYNEASPVRSSLVRRKMLALEEIIRIQKMGAVAEIHCHFFDINGRPFTPDELGFVPMAISIERMQQMQRFMIVVRPEKEKILPAIVAIKAGICTDLVLDHRIAYYILDEKNSEELGL